MSTAYDRDCCFRRSTNAGVPRVLWELNTTCNLGCGFCHARPHSDAGLPAAGVQAGLESLARLGIHEIIFSGGEPLLRPDCLPLLHRARQVGFQVDLCTNAVLITPEVAGQLSQSLAEISVSLDSADPSIHNRLRGRRRAWQLAVSGVRNLVNCGLEVHAISLVCDETVPGIQETVAFLAGLGVQSVTLLGLVPTADNSRDYRLSETSRNQLVAGLPGLRQRNPHIVINTKRITATESAASCGAGKNIWGITASGELIPCILLQGCSQGIPIPALSAFSTWEQVNAHLGAANPGPLWQRCDSIEKG